MRHESTKRVPRTDEVTEEALLVRGSWVAPWSVRCTTRGGLVNTGQLRRSRLGFNCINKSARKYYFNLIPQV